MRVYVLKELNEPNRPGAVLATFVVNDDNLPPTTLITKLARYRYELALYIPVGPRDKEDWHNMVRDEVRIDYDLEAGPEWPEKF